MGKIYTYLSYSLECEERYHENLLCYNAHAKIDIGKI